MSLCRRERAAPSLESTIMALLPPSKRRYKYQYHERLESAYPEFGIGASGAHAPLENKHYYAHYIGPKRALLKPLVGALKPGNKRPI